jgi:hypothetical protein
MSKIFNVHNYFIILAAIMLLPAIGCKKYLDEPLPAGEITESNAFVSDNSVSSVVTGNFLNLINSGIFSGSANSNLGYDAGLYTDELQYLGSATNNGNVLYKDAIEPSIIGYWSTMYTQIYDVNSALEGIQATSADLYFKNQWLGESYFTRALLYFYLTNMYGPVPLALTTNYQTNNVLSRAPQTQVYQQIIADCRQARSLLNYSYTNAYGGSATDRVRPDRYSATALLAKACLYNQQWDSAEAAADSVIANTRTYSLTSIGSAFAANDSETVWALGLAAGSETEDYQLYYNGMLTPMAAGSTPNTYSVFACLDTALVNTFEPGDLRYTNWVRIDSVSGTSPAVRYYFPNKYNTPSLTLQNQIILRMSDLYLIRAEARAQQGNISGAQADLNAVRARAGLPNTTATDQASLLSAIQHERRVELFVEEGNRFFDLKRWGTIDAVMTAFAPTKGATWSDYMQLFPIPTNDILQDPNLTVNPGYIQ